MAIVEKKTYDIIRFDNKLVYQGSYYLPVRALKTLCHIIGRYVDPEADKLPDELHIPLKEIEEAIKQNEGATWKSLYSDIETICRDLTSNPIRFKTNVDLEGVKVKGYINWCSSAVPYRDEHGNVFVRLGFDRMMSQFLLGLAEYVRLYRPELNRLKRAYAIRLFQMLKGIRNRRGKYEEVSVEKYGVDQIKFLFAMGSKYPAFKDFNKRVLKPCIKEINEKTTINIIKIEPIRNNRRQIIELNFHFADQEPDEPLKKPKVVKTLADYVPTENELEGLSWSKQKAYNMLIDFGVIEGIAYRKILPGIQGSEFKGYEDYFVQRAMDHFKRWSKQQGDKDQSAATFVQWWVDKKVFDVAGDVWPKILEKVVAAKKTLELTEPEKFENRQVAASMTGGEFKEWYKTNGKEEQ